MALKPEDVREKQVENKTVKEDKVKKDARNLFLSREGLVREGTQAAIGVSKEDLQMRTQGEKRKKVSRIKTNPFREGYAICPKLPVKVHISIMRRPQFFYVPYIHHYNPLLI